MITLVSGRAAVLLPPALLTSPGGNDSVLWLVILFGELILVTQIVDFS